MGADDSFATLAGRAERELEVRRSRFLAIAAPVADRPDAQRFLAEQATAHRNPTHVVPAFSLRDGERYASDAGEPAGSSGGAVLAAIAAAGLTDVAVVVVRWFGGTRLGVGGLRRAYGEAAAGALEAGVRRRRARGARARVRDRHEDTAGVLDSLRRSGARDLAYDFGIGATVEVTATLERVAVERLGLLVSDATRGMAAVELLGDLLIDR